MVTDPLDELVELRRLLAEAMSDAPDSEVSEGARQLRRKMVIAYERRRLQGQPEVSKHQEGS